MSRCNALMELNDGDIQCKLRTGHSGSHLWYRIFGDRVEWRWDDPECKNNDVKLWNKNKDDIVKEKNAVFFGWGLIFGSVIGLVFGLVIGVIV